MGTIDIAAKWVDVGITHPLALLSMAIAFAFCFLLSLWILSRLFFRHKMLCFLLLFLLFFVASPVVILTCLYKVFVDPEASSVGLGGPPFTLLPQIGGILLAACLFNRRRKKLHSNAISDAAEAPAREDIKGSLS
jgi:hypothetical protein